MTDPERINYDFNRKNVCLSGGQSQILKQKIGMNSDKDSWFMRSFEEEMQVLLTAIFSLISG